MNALDVLHRAGIRRLPTDTEAIAEHFGIKLVSYSSVARIYERDMAELYRISRQGYSFVVDGHYVCAINENSCGETRRRWTIAHELAHCLLGHIRDGRLHCTPEEERAADRFAAELLSPLAVVNFCGVTSAEELMRLCRLSRKASEIRFEQLNARRREAAHNRFSEARAGAEALSAAELKSVSDFSFFITEYIFNKKSDCSVLSGGAVRALP